MSADEDVVMTDEVAGDENHDDEVGSQGGGSDGAEFIEKDSVPLEECEPVDEEEENEMLDDVDDDEDHEEEGENLDEEQKEEELPEKKRARYVVPSRQDFKNDKTRELQERTVMIGPAQIEDLLTGTLVAKIKKAQHVSVRFNSYKKKTEGQKRDGETPNGDASEGEQETEFKGVAEVRFGTVEEADNFVEELGEQREGLSVQRISYEFTTTDLFRELKAMATIFDAEGISGTRINRTMAICGLAMDLNKDQIVELIPNASNVNIPINYGSQERKGYAYIEMPTQGKARDLMSEPITIDGIQYKVHVLEDIPNVRRVMSKIDEEKLNEELKSPMEPQKKDRLQQLLGFALHYEKLDDLTEKENEALQKRLTLLRARLREDKSFRVSRPRASDRGGYRGRGSGRSRGGFRGSSRGGSEFRTRSGPPPREPKRSYDSYDHHESRGGGEYPDRGYDDRYREPRSDSYRGGRSRSYERSIGGSSYRGSSSSYRGSGSSSRGGSSSYRGSSSSYRGSGSYSGGYRGSSSSYRGGSGGSSYRGSSYSSGGGSYGSGGAVSRKRTYSSGGPPVKRRQSSWYEEERGGYY